MVEINTGRLLPGEHRLLQLDDPGDAAGDQLAELVDHRGGRRVDRVVGQHAQADHPTRTFGDGLELDRRVGVEVIEPDVMDGGHLVRGSAAARRCRPTRRPPA